MKARFFYAFLLLRKLIFKNVEKNLHLNPLYLTEQKTKQVLLFSPSVLP